MWLHIANTCILPRFCILCILYSRNYLAEWVCGTGFSGGDGVPGRRVPHRCCHGDGHERGTDCSCVSGGKSQHFVAHGSTRLTFIDSAKHVIVQFWLHTEYLSVIRVNVLIFEREDLTTP